MTVPATDSPASAGSGLLAGTPGYRRISLALWCAGVGTFVLLYAVQGLLPLLARDFGVSAPVSSLSLSVATGALALSILPVSALAESWGRRRVLATSMATAAVLALLVPLAPDFGWFLALRTLQGVAMAGVPALAMAHLAQEVHPRSLGRAMGVLIAGNTFGGLTGRLVATTVADVSSWRWGMAAVGIVSLACLAGLLLLLPEPHGEQPPRQPARVLVRQLAGHLRDPGVRAACLLSFVLMSAFVSVYNYLGFRLLEAPFGLAPALVGLVFFAYLFGGASSTLAGGLGDRVGRLPVLAGGLLVGSAGALLSLPDLLPLVLTGLVVVTVGFFAAHSSASSWLSHHVTTAPAQASALYLLCYYAGSSIGGTLSGLAYQGAGWSGLVGVVVGLHAVGLVTTVVLLRRRH